MGEIVAKASIPGENVPEEYANVDARHGMSYDLCLIAHRE
jgi:hypothetical protein